MELWGRVDLKLKHHHSEAQIRLTDWFVPGEAGVAEMPLSLWWLILVLVAMYQVSLEVRKLQGGIGDGRMYGKAEGGEKNLPQELRLGKQLKLLSGPKKSTKELKVERLLFGRRVRRGRGEERKADFIPWGLWSKFALVQMWVHRWSMGQQR